MHNVIDLGPNDLVVLEIDGEKKALGRAELEKLVSRALQSGEEAASNRSRNPANSLVQTIRWTKQTLTGATKEDVPKIISKQEPKLLEAARTIELSEYPKQLQALKQLSEQYPFLSLRAYLLHDPEPSELDKSSYNS